MLLTRRHFGLGLSVVLLSACTQTGNSLTTQNDEMKPTPNSDYDLWVQSFFPRARNAGISQATLNVAFQGAGYLPGVVRRDRNQTEFKRSLEDYLSIAVSEERVARGREALTQNRSTLNNLEGTYGVPAEVLAAIWGLESFYGDRRGSVSVISATSTLAFDGRRGAFFEAQLIAALKIVQNGDITPSKLVGSWAGAMGHTQFIPTSYQAFAVDFDGDGRRDIWSDPPDDALASAASYLQKNGWQRGVNWGREITGSASGTVVQPQANGPRFEVTQNFRAIKRYNNSDAYAIGIGHLSDRIAGAGPLRTSFPPDANGLTKNDRVLLQERLSARGFDTQGTDGVIGPNSFRAISRYQSSIGIDPTGVPSPELLARLGR
ncbi:MAG: lytic murein transglycosylase [Roseobacter sp.]